MKTRVLEMLKENRLEEIRDLIKEKNSKDIAILAREIGKENFVIVFRFLSKDKAAEVFSHMSSRRKEELIQAITDKELEDIIKKLFTDDVVDLIEEMPSSVVNRILQNIDPKDRGLINEFLNYPKNSAGTIMTNEFIDLKEKMMAKEAIEYIQKTGVDKEMIYNLYVLDDTRKLIGILSIRELLFAEKTTLVKDIMKREIIYGETLENKTRVARRLQKYDFLALPIVDTEKRLVGIITIDDAIRTLQKDTTKSIHKMSAVIASEEEYFRTSVFKHSKNRIIWLTILMFSAMITEIIISRYNLAIAALPLIVSFIPLLMGTGGNSGSQSSTMVVRGLATEEIKSTDLIRVLFKEIKIATLIGTTLAIINGIRIFMQYNDIKLAIVVGISLILTITLAKSMGALLPIIAKKINIDPAIMAAPLITTVIDIVSVLIYFNIAIWILKI